MSEASRQVLTTPTTAALRRSLAADARRFVRDDPAHAVDHFRRRIGPFLDNGRAWLVEPAVRVLLTELKRDEALWRGSGEAATRLLEDAEAAHDEALTLAEQATAPPRRPVPAVEDVLLADSPQGTDADIVLTPPDPREREIEQVQVKWVTISHDFAESRRLILDSLLFDGAVTMLGAATGATAPVVAEPLLRQGRKLLFPKIRFLEIFNRQDQNEAALLRRIIGAMLYIRVDQDMLVTVLHGDEARPDSAEFYLAQIGEGALQRVQDHDDIRVRIVDVSRPAHLETAEALALAEQLLQETGARNPDSVVGLINGVEIGVQGVS